MSQNRATDILNDMEIMGVVRLSEVEDCRKKIESIMRTLDDNGVINLRGGTTFVK
jgi:flagellar motor switch protein FliG